MCCRFITSQGERLPPAQKSMDRARLDEERVHKVPARTLPEVLVMQMRSILLRTFSSS
jgi:hypothetical protein